MSARHHFTVLVALGALLCGAGCGGDSVATSAETEDPLYQQSLLLKKQGRSSEALTGLLKVIERRGEQASPESHLDAGLIYLEHIKDPVEAIHHFKKYLDLAPNSTKAALVRQRIDLARRELFRSMPGRPGDDQVGRFGGQELVERLQRENEDLRAELGRQRGSGPAPFVRTTRGPVDLPAPTQATVLAGMAPLKIAPMPPDFAPPTNEVSMAPAPQAYAARPPQVQTQPKQAGGTSRPQAAGTVAGKRHSVAPGETLFAIGRKYGVKPEAIAAVNRDRLPSGLNSKLSPGMELKIP